MSNAYRNGIQLWDPSLWLQRDPEAGEKMLRDADIAAAVQQRTHMIAGRNWTIHPLKKQSPRAEISVSIATELLEAIEDFPDVRLNLSTAFFHGSRFGRIHGIPRVLTIGDGKPRTWWVPTRIEDLDKRFYRIVVDTESEVGHWERWGLFEQEWIPETAEDALITIRNVYEDNQSSLGHGRALREALGWWWYAKENVFQESLQAVERFAQGIITAKVQGARDADTGLPNQTVIDEWTDVLENLRSRHVLVYDADDTIEMVSADGTGWEMLSQIRGELRSTIFTLILGSTLTTGQDGSTGSLALGEVHENSTETLIQYDRLLLEKTLTKSLLGCLWTKNHANLWELGIHNEKPRFSITQEKRLDPAVRAQVAQTLNAMGVPLAADDLYDQVGFRKPEDGEDKIEGAVAPAPGVGLPGIPGGLPFQR